jgi:hypothetical protein
MEYHLLPMQAAIHYQQKLSQHGSTRQAFSQPTTKWGIVLGEICLYTVFIQYSYLFFRNNSYYREREDR